MTTHNDLHDVETRLRASLRERSGDVQTTPALYERVQRQASRGTWLRRGFALAAAAAAVAGAVAVGPALWPDPTPFDVVDTPEESLPGDAPTQGGDAVEEQDGPAVPDALRDAGVAVVLDGALFVDDRAVTGPAPVASVTVASSWTASSGTVAAGLTDGRIGLVEQSAVASGEDFDLVVEAAANGSGVAFAPGDEAVAWIEGTDLHVWPLATGAQGERVLPLIGDVPDNLRIEQWFSGADAQVILASDPAGGVWRIPMDDSNVFNSAPTDPASLLPAAADAAAVDAALLPDLSIAVLRIPADGTAPTLDLGGLPVPLDEVRDATAELSVTGSALTLHDPTTGTGSRRDADADSIDLVATWEAAGVVAVAPLPLVTTNDDDAEQVDQGGDASALGLPTDAPVIGTDGVALVIREADGTETRRDVYPPAESEAALGDLAVRPGSTSDDGLVAIESSSEGETSIRFARLDGDTAGPVGSVVVTAGEVSGLVWSEDGTHVAWTDPDGLWAIEVVGDGEQAGAPQFLAEDQRAIVDWVWTEGGDGATLVGWFALRTGQSGTEFLGVEQSSDGGLALTAPVGGGDRLVFDTHASPGAAVGPDVSAELLGSAVALRWGADGDRFGELAAPGDVGGDVRLEVSGGQVIVMGSVRHQLVTFDGDVVELPLLTDWDVLD